MGNGSQQAVGGQSLMDNPEYLCSLSTNGRSRRSLLPRTDSRTRQRKSQNTSELTALLTVVDYFDPYYRMRCLLIANYPTVDTRSILSSAKGFFRIDLSSSRRTIDTVEILFTYFTALQYLCDAMPQGSSIAERQWRERMLRLGFT